MGASKHIKMALVDKGLTIKDLHEKSGSGSPLQSLYNQFNRDTWKFSDVEKLAALIDCQVVLVNNETGRTY